MRIVRALLGVGLAVAMLLAVAPAQAADPQARATSVVRAAEAAADQCPNTLWPGEVLGLNQYLDTVVDDCAGGLLGIYPETVAGGTAYALWLVAGDGDALWHTPATKPGTGDPFLIMQADGNAVFYDGTGTPVWSSGTHGHPGARLVVQMDGNMVVYSSTNRPLWNKGVDARLGLMTHGIGLGPDTQPGGWYNSSPSKAVTLIPQMDGNLVLYGNGRPLWSSQTVTGVPSTMRFQEDGNVVLYQGTGAQLGRAVWASRSFGAVQLRVQDDGNLVAYNAQGRAVWATYTFL